MPFDTTFTRRLGLRHPIIQGPFGGGLSSVDLVVAVAQAGGLGSFGAHHLGPDEIVEVAAAIRARTAGPFNLNLWVSDHDADGLTPTPEQFAQGVARHRPFYDELGIAPPASPPRHYGERFDAQMPAILEARPPVFSFAFGIPPQETLEECRRRSIVSLGAVTTVDEALAMESAGVDAIVATGFEAGGHRVSFLRAAEDSLTGTFALIPQVVDRVKIPVVAAGGIVDARGVAAAFALGAHAVQVGTAFLACEESNASPLHRAALFSERAKTTVLSRAYSGRLARGIRNRFTDVLLSNGTAPLPYPAQNWFTGSFKQAAIAQGRDDFIALWSGQAAPLLRHRTAKALFDELAAVHSTIQEETYR